MNNLWISLLPFVIFFVWLLLFGTRRTRFCPDCAEPLAAVQLPWTKTGRQWLEGGVVCRHCGCETDIADRKAAAATPERRTFAFSLSLLILAMIPAIVLLAMLNER